MKPHKHCEVIKAWADGATIEYTDAELIGWFPAPAPSWKESRVYRVKPESHGAVISAEIAEIRALLDALEAKL